MNVNNCNKSKFNYKCRSSYIKFIKYRLINGIILFSKINYGTDFKYFHF